MEGAFPFVLCQHIFSQLRVLWLERRRKQKSSDLVFWALTKIEIIAPQIFASKFTVLWVEESDLTRKQKIIKSSVLNNQTNIWWVLFFSFNSMYLYICQHLRNLVWFFIWFFCCFKQSFCSLIVKPCIKSVLGVLYILFAFECCCLVVFFFSFWMGGFCSLFVCVCILSPLQQCGQIAPRICCFCWLVTPLPAKISARFLWHTEHRITSPGGQLV